jgi:hypothetical protein
MKTLSKILTLALILSTTMVCTLPSKGWALLAPAQDAGSTSRAADMRSIRTSLESKAVGERLRKLGLDQKEIDSRLSRLSDRELRKFAKDVDALAAGGDVGGIIVLILLIVLIVFLVKRL